MVLPKILKSQIFSTPTSPTARKCSNELLQYLLELSLIIYYFFTLLCPNLVNLAPGVEEFGTAGIDDRRHISKETTFWRAHQFAISNMTFCCDMYIKVLLPEVPITPPLLPVTATIVN